MSWGKHEGTLRRACIETIGKTSGLLQIGTKQSGSFASHLIRRASVSTGDGPREVMADGYRWSVLRMSAHDDWERRKNAT